VTVAAPRRVVVFLDYQNAYHRAREAFCARDAAAREGQVDPLLLGRLLADRVTGGLLSAVRVYHRVDADAIVVAEVFAKKTQATPRSVLDACRHRFRVYDTISADKE